jgi:hypothetical protein
VTSISSIITGGTTFNIVFSTIRNPFSFANLTGISTLTKSANTLYSYSTSTTTNGLQNNVPTSFANITYQYSPQQLNQSVVLQVSFQLSQYTLMPAYFLLSIDTYFSVSSLTCSSFINFIGSCTPISSNTLKIAGTFNNSVMGLTVGGFSSQLTAPSSTTYTTLASFDSNNGKID